MKKLERKTKRTSKNYIKIETSGLSREIDSLIAVSIIEKNSEIVKTFCIENFKEEKKLLEEVLPLISGRELVSYSGKSFDIPFIKSKTKFYFNKDIDLNFIDLQEITKKYNFIFNLSSHSNKALIEKFIEKEALKDKKNYEGIKIKTLFKKYVEGEKESLEKILEYNFISLENLISLDLKISENLCKELSLNILNFMFFIEDLKLKNNTIEILGLTNYNKNYFNTKEQYTLEINNRDIIKNSRGFLNFCKLENKEELAKDFPTQNKKFSLKINTEDALYDAKNLCYYIQKKDLPFEILNREKIKSPSQIIILYYKDHKFKNEKEVMKKIIEKELKY
ncbi:exonuclease [Peptoniphilus sp. AGMB00490]|uniref:Exonuclease n=2 Tax=Peptoniphilus TaxID=162289 RepID=A0ACD6AYY1_9FIRM|nr:MULTISPECIES: ribonuclease H-like domain-containing protein [Peptoniphilus]NMW86030.1 exonuclease [Peptoniphilus faecalis]OLR64451.1 exonuclease [Peptoniphilus porci]